MALSQRQDLRTSQSPFMTSQLQQAIRILQFSNLELAAYVDGEVQGNPLIDRDDSPDDESDTGIASLTAVTSATVDDVRLASPSDTYGWDGDSTGLAIPDLDAQPGEPHQPWFGIPGFELANHVRAEKTLRQHLYEQLGVELTDPGERIIGAHLIERLDDTGYLTGDIRDIPDLLGCTPALVEAVLECLQGFDPPGMFARNLAECLALQLRERDRLDPAMQSLLANLDRLAKGDLSGLRRLCGVDNEDLRDMATEIKALDPKPGLSFGASPGQVIVPDILMREGPGGNWILELNADTLPRVLVNNSYYAEVSKRAMSRSDREYMTECYRSANWLVRSLHQRATTILRVAGEIVQQQDAFFQHGVQHLKPLVLRNIAEVIRMHESTVSRVTSNKYIATPRGLLELKYFFTSAIASASGGDALSAEAVRSRIRLLIDQEAPNQVLSDDRLTAILQEQGVDIARRTVAKYREAMHIPSSNRRRRKKQGSF